VSVGKCSVGTRRVRCRTEERTPITLIPSLKSAHFPKVFGSCQTLTQPPTKRLVPISKRAVCPNAPTSQTEAKNRANRFLSCPGKFTSSIIGGIGAGTSYKGLVVTTTTKNTYNSARGLLQQSCFIALLVGTTAFCRSLLPSSFENIVFNQFASHLVSSIPSQLAKSQ
jgi:hypothetical protein